VIPNPRRRSALLTVVDANRNVGANANSHVGVGSGISTVGPETDARAPAAMAV
jgi:hypothetical protein